MGNLFDTVLLLALPASGKSEVRTYMSSLTPEQCREQFHMGPTLQLDDFPYVHFMRRVDEELNALGEEGVFFWSPERPFRDPVDWGTLLKLVNEDYDDLCASRPPRPASASAYYLDRLTRARAAVRGLPPFAGLDDALRKRLEETLLPEAQKMLAEKQTLCSEDKTGKTIVIEFARGGPAGASMPLPAPFGYQYALSQLSDAILTRSVVLYIWVMPEESRRKNRERANPLDPGSILHHGTPEEVMYHDYGGDDIRHLLETSGKEGHLRVVARNRVHFLRFSRFDNRVDKTTFLRQPASTWEPRQVKALHDELLRTMGRLAAGSFTQD